MSVYDQIVSSVINGETVKVPLNVNVAGIRSCFFREKKKLAELGFVVQGVLQFRSVEEEGYRTVRLHKAAAVQFEVVTGGSNEKGN